MTTKNYGEVLRKALSKLEEENATRLAEKKEVLSLEDINEIAAQAVIKEFCTRNSELIGYAAKSLLESNNYSLFPCYKLGQLPSEGEFIPIFLSPQPKEMVLPSVEEIALVLTDQVYIDVTTRKKAEEILLLLKGKNKND